MSTRKNTRKPSSDLSKAAMIFHRDGHDAEHTIHYQAPRGPTLSPWGHCGQSVTLCGEATGRVYGVPLGIRTGHRGEVTCPACLEAIERGEADVDPFEV